MYFGYLQNINILPGQCFIHASYCTEFSTHTTSIAVVVLRFSAVADCFCSFRIQSAFKLCIPVKNTAGICHLIIDISCSRNSFGNISSMSCNLRSNDSLFCIFNIWKSKVFSRCYICLLYTSGFII